jgi:hypothetical protein
MGERAQVADFSRARDDLDQLFNMFRGSRTIDPDQSVAAQSCYSFERQQKEPIMATSDIIVLVGLVLAFSTFAAVLAWTDFRTHHVHK